MSIEKLEIAVLKYWYHLQDSGELSDGKATLTGEDLGVDDEILDEVIRSLDSSGYVENIGYADNRPYAIGGMRVTEKGRNHLKENSATAKSYRTLKELRDWIKL